MDPRTERAGRGAGGGAHPGAPGSSPDDVSVGSTDTPPSLVGGAAVAAPPPGGGWGVAPNDLAASALVAPLAAEQRIAPYSATQDDGAVPPARAQAWRPWGDA